MAYPVATYAGNRNFPVRTIGRNVSLELATAAAKFKEDRRDSGRKGTGDEVGVAASPDRCASRNRKEEREIEGHSQTRELKPTDRAGVEGKSKERLEMRFPDREQNRSS
ncbi:hypothetical protein JCGZ_22760 [Jatropha curcas]|uniref:Uncharacterized protein n=1 Tax=Jatropha curcas TaxID=180498 RepID=A0A067L7N7_JATCU|nr:hypothetical protein JCGZ_22760 [Jatropha curcas]